MMNHRRFRIPALLALCAAVLAALPAAFGLAAEDAAPIAIAVIDFGYVDTSGEERDQRGEHQARLDAFMRALKGALVVSGRFRLVVPACRPDPCSLAGTPQADLADAARVAGADLLLIGSIHKMSTLIEWAKVDVADVRTGQVVLDRLLTFRGDTDEAWKRAEAFIADEVTSLRVR